MTMSDVIQNINRAFQPTGSLVKIKSQALADFNKYGIPTVKHEEWKYTRVSGLLQVPFAIQAENDIEPELLQKYLLPCSKDGYLINFENGKPAFLFRGAIADLIDGAEVHLSLSHDGAIASAMVVLER